MKRKYTLKRRAEGRAETRRRIVEATVALHQEVGPAATQIAEVARRAGVQRATVYNHFPVDAELFEACSAHWRNLHPMPDSARWEAIDDPGRRVRMGLAEVYAWYRETRAMTRNVLHDAPSLPALQEIIGGGLLKNVDRLAGILAAPFEARGLKADRIRVATRTAIDFEFWRLLETLGDKQVAGLGASLVESVALPASARE
jgi:AcrR family transcriptional regulator